MHKTNTPCLPVFCPLSQFTVSEDQRHVLEEMEESATLITDNGKGFREAGKLAPSLK